MRRARRGATVAVLLALVAAVLPGAVRPTAAAWTDQAMSGPRVAVGSDACTATGDYTGQASSALLAGTVQGDAVGAPAALAPSAVGERTDAVSSARAVVTPAAAAAALTAGVALTTASSWNQSASTTGTGGSAAAAGGTAAVGRVDVSGLLTRPPTSASSLPGLSGVGLDVGAVASSSSLNGCAAAWGDSGVLVRSSSVSDLGLRFSDAAATAALSTVQARGSAAAASLTTLAGASSTTSAISGAVADGLLAAVTQSLTSGTASPSGATASVSVVTTPITATGTGVQTAGRTTVDVASGAVAVSLPVPSGPNGDALSTARVAAIATDAGTALRQRATALITAQGAARDSATVAVHASIDVALAGLKVAVVSLDAALPASAWAATPGPALQAQVQLLGTSALRADLGTAVTAALATTLLPRVRAALTSSFLQPARDAAAADSVAVSAAVDGAAGALGTDLAALPSVLTVTVDQRAALDADSWTGAAAAGSGGVTAVRVRVRDALGTRADLFLGSTAVGPNRPAHP